MVQKLRNLLIGLGVSLFVIVPTVSAQLTSPNYQAEETFFGTGGELDSSSPNYRARLGAGETGVGKYTSPSYQFDAGFNTTDAELLEVAVSGGTFDLGVLEPEETSYGSAVFTIRNYLATGYVVRLTGTSLRTAGGQHVISPMSIPAGISPGTEQFGVNVVANSSPVIGEDPLQIPDDTFSFGAAAEDYNVPNQFKFIDDDVIAESLSSSGMTEFMLSFIANINTNTPAGFYGTSLYVKVIPTF